MLAKLGGFCENGNSMNGTWLLIESSGRTARVGLARDGIVVCSRTLDETRRLARDLAPAVGELLQEDGIGPKDVDGVMVSVGPGSYTGLRVGITAAKAFAYSTGCKLIAVPTFAAIALHAPDCNAWVIADALQGLIYRQRYSHGAAVDELRIETAAEALASVPSEVWLTGPGLATYKLNDAGLVAEPSLENLLRAGSLIQSVSREALFALEPLYLRGSSAEEKAKANEPRPEAAVRQ